MSWLWGSSSSEANEKSSDKAASTSSRGSDSLPKDQFSYENVFLPDAPVSDSSADPTSLGSAFADQADFRNASDSSFFSTDASLPNNDASFLPAHDAERLGTDASPSVNFNAMGSINPGTVAPAFGIYTAPNTGGVEYVFSDDYKEIRKRSATEQLTYFAGSAYLSGAAIGGAIGFWEGAKASMGKSAKLRLNAVLNSSARRGVAASNSLAVLALLFSLSESVVYQYTNDDIAFNYATAGAATGALYKCTRGVRVAGLGAAAGAAIALATVYAARKGTYGRGLQGVL